MQQYVGVRNKIYQYVNVMLNCHRVMTWIFRRYHDGATIYTFYHILQK